MSVPENRFIYKIRSAKTWERADFWIRLKDKSETINIRNNIPREEYLPITLSIIKALFLIAPALLLFRAYWDINSLFLIILFGAVIPLTMAWGAFLDVIIKNYIIKHQ